MQARSSFTLMYTRGLRHSDGGVFRSRYEHEPVLGANDTSRGLRRECRIIEAADREGVSYEPCDGALSKLMDGELTRATREL